MSLKKIPIHWEKKISRHKIASVFHLSHTRGRRSTLGSLSPSGPLQVFPPLCPHTLSLPLQFLGSQFGTRSCLLSNLDYLIYLCWNLSTRKGVSDDLSLLVNTSLFAFGIWRQQNKTKHILTKCLLSNYGWCCQFQTVLLPASEMTSRERQRNRVSHFYSLQTDSLKPTQLSLLSGSLPSQMCLSCLGGCFSWKHVWSGCCQGTSHRTEPVIFLRHHLTSKMLVFFNPIYGTVVLVAFAWSFPESICFTFVSLALCVPWHNLMNIFNFIDFFILLDKWY